MHKVYSLLIHLCRSPEAVSDDKEDQKRGFKALQYLQSYREIIEIKFSCIYTAKSVSDKVRLRPSEIFNVELNR